MWEKSLVSCLFNGIWSLHYSSTLAVRACTMAYEVISFHHLIPVYLAGTVLYNFPNQGSKRSRLLRFGRLVGAAGALWLICWNWIRWNDGGVVRQWRWWGVERCVDCVVGRCVYLSYVVAVMLCRFVGCRLVGVMELGIVEVPFNCRWDLSLCG